MSDAPMFSRDELLGGLPARRASTVMFAIEARAAHLAARSRRAMAVHETQRTSAERERAFLDALAGARELPEPPTIQDLERFALKWEDVAPTEPDLRAALARHLGRKYRFTRESVPRIRTVLGFDDPGVQAAYQRLHDEPLDSVYAEALPAKERAAWTRSRLAMKLEELPPFWTAYALALTEAVGAGILALPIALAGIGPLPGMAFLAIAGLFNLLTIGGMVEAITRNGRMRYLGAYFGRLAGVLLGRGGSWSITTTLFVLNVVTFLTYLLAFAAPLADVTRIDPMAWVALLFVVNMFFLRRDLDATVASALTIGVVNVVLLLAISAMAMFHVNVDNLSFARLPFFGDDPAPLSTVGLVFGVVILAYFGHSSCGLVARTVLEREPTGKALLRGSIAATATVMVLYCIAVFAINGAVSPNELAGYNGTALEPLADEVGPGITVLGTIYILLAVGLVSIYGSLGMASQMKEWLPRHASGARGFLIAAAPTVAVFVIVEWLLVVDRASVSEPLAIAGTLSVPLLGGVFPMMLLAAGRRSGDRVPGSWVRILRGPKTIALVAAIFVAGLAVQGFVIWRRPVERIATAAVLAFTGAVFWIAYRRGSFRPQAAIELRHTAGHDAATVMIDGALVGAEVATEDTILSGRRVKITFPPDGARVGRVWAHEVAREGETIPLAMRVTVIQGDSEPLVLQAPEGAARFALTGQTCEVTIEPMSATKGGLQTGPIR